MRKKLVAMMAFAGTALCTAMFGEAQAQLVKLPAVPFTVADCHSGDHWGSSPSHGGLLRCLTNNPPPAPTCPAGTIQTSAPVWNGENWSSPVCTPSPPPSLPPPLKKAGLSPILLSDVGHTFGFNGTFTASLRIDNAIGTWACYGVLTSYNNTPGDTPDQIYNGPFTSDYASCSISGDTATTWGNCDSLSGGDNNSCIPGSTTATIIGRDQCNVTFTANGFSANGVSTYNTCQ